MSSQISASKFLRGGVICNYIIYQLIGNMGIFVQLFFILSGFSMCCGYYERIKNSQISLNEFYRRRYWKILPFFIVLVFMDLAVSLVFDGGISIDSIYEAFADLTLMFGLFPVSQISVIGVGWTLGVIFGFYILFPFFVFLIWNKKRAWFSFLLLIAVNYVCSVYFIVDDWAVDANTLRWLCFFIAGGLIYLYRDDIGVLYEKLGRRIGSFVGIILVLAGIVLTLSFRITEESNLDVFISTVQNLLGFSLMVIGCIGFENKFWNNPMSRFVSKVSLEIYLAHMMVFRVMEKLRLTTIAGENVGSYIISCIGTIGGALIFAVVYQYIEAKIKKKVEKA